MNRKVAVFATAFRLSVFALVSLVTVAQSGPEDLRLTVGKSIVIDYPADIARISTSNADIVDASPVTTREILLHGKSYGTVTLVVWSKTGQRNFYNITVEQNLESLRKLLKETFPREEFHVQSSRDSLSLTGHVSSKDVAERATALATPFAKTVVNSLQVNAPPPDKQILLRVKFAELDRSMANQFAVNLLSTGAGNTPGSITTGQFPSASATDLSGTIGGKAAGTTTKFTISDALNILAFRPDLNFGVLIKALQSKSVLQILAEPNLVTTNGKEASFVVGGEFPVPVLQGGANSGSVTIQFREFGVRLSFNPLITENGNIRMHVKPEVSTLDYANAVTFNGFTIPALSTRKMDTDIELGEGQSFVIAGLIDNRFTESMSKIPGLADLPIFGTLFKSKNLNKSSTELIVMVTPEITMPLQPGDPKPSIDMPGKFISLVPMDTKTVDAGKK
ncbi:MAG: pilus assembly protein N-terminal domain-containing protein [Acidobacteriaceae bacterium]|nr:pilus assembly protein N-terminal domain-containing protein [Acidobacteriaceae bacterium]